MSAGNYVLSSNVYAPSSGPPYNITVLGAGNYWIEEIDFIFGYFTNSAAGSNNFSLEIFSGATLIWATAWMMQATAAATVPLNIPYSTRPRIFLPRGNNVNFSGTGWGTPPVSQIVFSLNIYGRSLP